MFFFVFTLSAITALFTSSVKLFPMCRLMKKPSSFRVITLFLLRSSWQCLQFEVMVAFACRSSMSAVDCYLLYLKAWHNDQPTIRRNLASKSPHNYGITESSKGVPKATEIVHKRQTVATRLLSHYQNGY